MSSWSTEKRLPGSIPARGGHAAATACRRSATEGAEPGKATSTWPASIASLAGPKSSTFT
eukprot:CAMPEP_0168716212 /NCGR_PEP_ID=MMETSP0503-20121227/45593_1 /TAXON_ID=89963 /ORGANISM="Heterocapsa rotundata, Strain SCCAP K-0483" /LENGTH=59 /DNA_ID=CAMNT_0008762681 /DNA_START=18 /DNA_END=194 /DNA_ORIENTATION=-